MNAREKLLAGAGLDDTVLIKVALLSYHPLTCWSPLQEHLNFENGCFGGFCTQGELIHAGYTGISKS